MIIIENKNEIRDLYLKYDQIYIYGAGNVAKKLLMLCSPFIDLYRTRIIVSNTNNNPKNYHGIDIKKIDYCNNENYVVIIAVSRQYWKEIFDLLNSNGYNNIALLHERFEQEVLSYSNIIINNSYRPHTLLRFQVQVAEHCNLNCKGCAHFAPLAQPEFLNIDIYNKDCARLSELFDQECEWIHLMGGEPLLNPELINIIKITRNYFLYGRIYIVTNGILLPSMDDRFWRACFDYKIQIMATRYPLKNLDYNAMKEKATAKGVEFSFINETESIKRLRRYTLNEKGLENIENNYSRCPGANECITLRNGRLYTCVWPAHAHHLIKYFNLNMHVSKRDGVDIYSVADADELMNKLSHPIPFCKYCRLDHQIDGIPFSISCKEKKEWLEV